MPHFSAWTARSVTLVGALLLSTAFTAPAFADIEVVVVTAEKRSQDVQTVPIAISVFGSEKRDQLGITSIQDMTNFTPGLQYSTSTDRISLRGVGRLTNVLSADASVANYDDGLYETFAVAAGRSPLDIERVEVLRGPQGTLYGRNAIAGASTKLPADRRPSSRAKFAPTYGNYDHVTLEGAFSGPIADGWEYKFYVNWDYQNQGYAKNIVPGRKSEYGRLNDLYHRRPDPEDLLRRQARLLAEVSDRLVVWRRRQRRFAISRLGSVRQRQHTNSVPHRPGLNPGYGCTAPGFTDATPNTTVVRATSPLPAATACLNPGVSTPWKIAHLVSYNVNLPSYENVNMHLTWHAKDFDIKYIGGGTYYHYILTGGTQNGGEGSSNARAPISSYKLFSNSGAPFGLGSVVGLTVNPVESFNYQEHNGFISNEVNFISTGDSPLQWVAGIYQFQQHYSQPVFVTSPVQPQWNGVTPPLRCAAAFFCAQTGGVCAPETGFRRFDNQPRMHASSEAVYGQLEYKWSDELKFTGGLRWSMDRKYGVENVRLLCFGVPACFTAPENQFHRRVQSPGGGSDSARNGRRERRCLVRSPRGVTGLTTYNPVTGLASARLPCKLGRAHGNGESRLDARRYDLGLWLIQQGLQVRRLQHRHLHGPELHALDRQGKGRLVRNRRQEVLRRLADGQHGSVPLRLPEPPGSVGRGSVGRRPGTERDVVHQRARIRSRRARNWRRSSRRSRICRSCSTTPISMHTFREAYLRIRPIRTRLRRERRRPHRRTMRWPDFTAGWSAIVKTSARAVQLHNPAILDLTRERPDFSSGWLEQAAEPAWQSAAQRAEEQDRDQRVLHLGDRLG